MCSFLFSSITWVSTESLFEEQLYLKSVPQIIKPVNQLRRQTHVNHTGSLPGAGGGAVEVSPAPTGSEVK